MSKHKYPPFVMVTNQVLDSPAWRSMSLGARLLYIALKRRYSPNGRNNGRIYLPQREAQKQIGSGRTEIARWFRELQHYGFIVMMEGGCLGVDGKGRAPRWRLTEVAYMRGSSSKGAENMPTMDFLKWKGALFSTHRAGGQHVKLKPESRSRKLDHSGPENWTTYGPETRTTPWNKWSRNPDQVSHASGPETRTNSYKPSGAGRAGSLLKPRRRRGRAQFPNNSGRAKPATRRGPS